MRNLNDLLRQAQDLQKKLEKINEELEQIEIEGSAQSIVKAVVNGKLEIISITFTSDIKEIDSETLADLITVAVKDAQNKAKVVAQEKFATLGAFSGFLPNFPNGIN